jgi:hypothetical protein
MPANCQDQYQSSPTEAAKPDQSQHKQNQSSSGLLNKLRETLSTIQQQQTNSLPF